MQFANIERYNGQLGHQICGGGGAGPRGETEAGSVEVCV